MKYSGFYINLDQNPERRQGIEEELMRNHLAGYQRYAARLGNALGLPPGTISEGEVGCFTSHYKLLCEHKDHIQPLHVIEDDIILSPQTEQVLDWVISNGQLEKFDLVYTDVAVPVLNDACHEYKAYYDATVKRNTAGKIERVIFSVVDMQALIFASTCSFLVNPKSIGKLSTLYEKELHAGATLPIDLFIRKLCHEKIITVGCVFPFVTSIRPESCFSTTMGKRFEGRAAMAANMLRHSFYIGCDWQTCLDEARRFFPQPEAEDTHRQIMLTLLGYSLTSGYKKV